MNTEGKKLIEIVKNKKVLFITTKNIDYIRNTQEINILKKNAREVELIFSTKKKYLCRVLEVWNKIKKLNVERNDLVFVGFAPQLVIPFIGYKFKNIPIIIDFFISVYDTFVCDRKKIKKHGILARLCHLIDEKTLKRADYVITDTKAHANYFISEFNANANNFEVIYLEADSNIYYPRKQNKLDELKNKYVVCYFGSILPLQGVDVVLDAIRNLRNEDEIFFEIIGPIPEKYNKPIQKNVKYINWLSQEELAEHIANADLCLAGHFSGSIEKAKRTIPGKAYIYEKMERPMILGDGEANHELFQCDDMHHFVEMGSKEALKEKILELYYREEDTEII